MSCHHSASRSNQYTRSGEKQLWRRPAKIHHTPRHADNWSNSPPLLAVIRVVVAWPEVQIINKQTCARVGAQVREQVPAYVYERQTSPLVNSQYRRRPTQSKQTILHSASTNTGDVVCLYVCVRLCERVSHGKCRVCDKKTERPWTFIKTCLPTWAIVVLQS
jgi:hypothetical protein